MVSVRSGVTIISRESDAKTWGFVLSAFKRGGDPYGLTWVVVQGGSLEVLVRQCLTSNQAWTTILGCVIADQDKVGLVLLLL